jgi:hypothetical protein
MFLKRGKNRSRCTSREFFFNHPIRNTLSQALVAHTCNLSYSEGRDQEIRLQKRADVVAQGVGPEFKPQCHQKNHKQTKKHLYSDTQCIPGAHPDHL